MHNPKTTDPLIDALWTSPGAERPTLILPDGCVDVIEREGDLVVVGPMTRARSIPPRQTRQRGARFVPGGVLSWLGTSPEELTDQVVPLRHLLGPPSPHTLDGLLAAARRRANPCPRITAAVRALLDDPTISVEPLAGIGTARPSDPFGSWRSARSVERTRVNGSIERSSSLPSATTR